jgi:hypothetical protein
MQSSILTAAVILAGTLTSQQSRFTRCYFYLPSKPCLRPFPLPGPPLLYLQPLSLLFPTLWSSSLPGENTAVIERPHGPDRHCGTSLAPSAELGEATCRRAAVRLPPPGYPNIQLLSRPFLVAVTGPVRFLVVGVWGSRSGGAPARGAALKRGQEIRRLDSSIRIRSRRGRRAVLTQRKRNWPKT